MSIGLLLLACFVPIQPSGSDVVGGLWSPPEGEADVADTDLGPPPDTDPPDTEEPPPPRVLLNEVMSKNTSAWQVEGALPDWIELYNADAVAVELNDLTVTDKSGRVWMGGEGTLEPGARLVLFADAGEGPTHAPFSLDADGDQLTVAGQGTASDRLALGALDADVAWARHPDGGTWAPTIDTTPDAPNGDTPSASLDRTDTVFQLDTLTHVEIALDADDEASLRANRLSWVEGGVTIEGIAYPSVGVRLKAYVGSSRTLDQKCGFKVDLNRYEDREWRGIEGLTLNNMVQDPSYVNEHLSYMLYRAVGVPAPRVGYARVSVNGEDFGLYLLVESIDDRFLDRWYGDSSGALYEGAYGVDLFAGYENSFDYDEGPDSTDRSDLTAVIAVLDGASDDAGIAALEDLVDMDELLTNMAVEALILHWDGYTTRNNYRLYHDPRTGRFQIIPWGTDQTFTSLYYYPWSAYGRLFTFCLANEACAARYDAKLVEVSYVMEGLGLPEEAEDLHTWLLPEINSDPRREFGYSTHMGYYAATLNTIAGWPAAVRALVDDR